MQTRNSLLPYNIVKLNKNLISHPSLCTAVTVGFVGQPYTVTEGNEILICLEVLDGELSGGLNITVTGSVQGKLLYFPFLALQQNPQIMISRPLLRGCPLSEGIMLLCPLLEVLL